MSYISSSHINPISYGQEYPESYWSKTIDEIPDDDGNAPFQQDTEVAIIGGGYTGLSCAYHLAHNHGINAVVLEANRPGWGCSGRNGGFARMALGRYSASDMLQKWGPKMANELFQQCVSSLNLVKTLIKEGQIECDALEAGHLKIAHRKSRVDALRNEATILQKIFKYPAQFIEAKDLNQNYLGGSQSFGALQIPDAISLHPLKLSLGMLKMARNAGAIVYSNSPVLEINKKNEQYSLTTLHGKLNAKIVVIATNGYTPEALSPTLTDTLLPVLSHIIVTRPLTNHELKSSGFLTQHLLTDTRNLLYYWRLLPDNRILFGGRGQISDRKQTHQKQKIFLLSELIRKYPSLKDVTVEYDWHGWVCVTRDYLPHIYHAKNDRTLLYGLGYQGSGVSMSLYAGKLLANSIESNILNAIPPTHTPLKPYPLHSLIRIPQAVAYQWYKFLDNKD